MRKYFYKFYVVFLIVLTASQLKAQDRVIHGMVTTFDSIPLIGVKIKIKSTKQVVFTDTLGNFAVGCNKKDKIILTAKGFYKQNVKLTDKIKFVAVNMKIHPGEKPREYAIGYGYVKDKDKLAALSNLNNNDIDFTNYNNLYDLIRGRFAGVQIMNGEIIIRGINSINSSSAALIVVDGVISDESALTTIPPVEVKSINVIKDGSSAIYGSRGANGVVIIETKRGGDER
ncbi:MAG: TonB-dependent receptor plug domain-containing protein [Prolixibacteraceae bacterium]|nr:TonB-dependent receptor plug domain-containing protein [Prolixibacteraceae bacterium]